MTNETIRALLGAVILTATSALAADKDKPETKPVAAAKLFEDEIVCKGKGVEIRRSQVDDALLQLKAELRERGQVFPEARREDAETQLLDRLVATQLLVHSATEQDKAEARTEAGKRVAEAKRRAGSEEAFQRLLKVRGVTAEKFETEVLERTICEEVVDRELKSKVTIADEHAQKFYADNSQEFERPEMLRAAHILLSTRDSASGQELNEDKKKEKRQQMQKILERARKGEDFAALAKEFSDDPGSRDNGGEYTFPRGQMVPEFETAAFSLKTNQVSDIVTTQFGYHLIKLHERVPAQKLEYAKVEKDLKEYLSRQEVERQLPGFLGKLKKVANLEYLAGAKPPGDPSAVAPPDKPSPKADANPDN